MSHLVATPLTRWGLAGFEEVEQLRADRRRAVTEPYADDPILPLAEGHVRVFDPDRLQAVPFEPWEHQERLLRAWITDDFLAGEGPLGNVHVEKSRQMGDTWALAYGCLWLLTYRDLPLLMTHERVDEVCDSGPTIDSFFGKVKFMYDEWPDVIGRAPLLFIGGAAPIIRNRASPQSYLAGEGARPDPGRGGRYAGVVIDEAARIRFDREAHRALARACPYGRVMLSTPKGEGNVYYRLRESRPRGWTFLRHHWSEHPIYATGLHVAGEGPDCDKCGGVEDGLGWRPDEDATHRYPGKLTSEWYDEAVRELTDEDVAAELDIDYAGSLVARVFPEFSAEVHVWDEPIAYDPALVIELGWDYGVADPTSIVVCQESADDFRVIGELELRDSNPEEVVAGLAETLLGLGVEPRLLKSRTHRESRIRSVGDPAGEARSIATNRPLVADYRRLGFPIASRQQPLAVTINAVRRLLMGRPKPLRVSPDCFTFARHMKAWTWPTDTHGNRKPGASRPTHDEHSHLMDAFRYLVGSKWPAAPTERSVAHARARLLDYDERRDSGRLDASIGYDFVS